MGKFEHTVQGYNQARDFLLQCGYRDDYLDRLESHEMIYVANKIHLNAAKCHSGTGIPYSMEGCHAARNFLLSTGYTDDYLDRLDGHELIFLANQMNASPVECLQG